MNNQNTVTSRRTERNSQGEQKKFLVMLLPPSSMEA
jgi:hypothetical protein